MHRAVVGILVAILLSATPASAGVAVTVEGTVAPSGADVTTTARHGDGPPARFYVPPNPESARDRHDADEAPALNVTMDLPVEANPGEVVLVTIHVVVPDGGVARNVNITAAVDPAYHVLPSWRHDAWRGGELTWHLDVVNGSDSVYYHVRAPVGDAPRNTTFAANATSPDGDGGAVQDVLVRAATDPDPQRARIVAVAAAGYVATLTAPPLPDGLLP